MRFFLFIGGLLAWIVVGVMLLGEATISPQFPLPICPHCQGVHVNNKQLNPLGPWECLDCGHTFKWVEGTSISPLLSQSQSSRNHLSPDLDSIILKH
jgi:ribosomal protein L37AE/L43A